MEKHPRPWRIEYWQRFPEWDKHASPYVVDANGVEVVSPKQNVRHPGTRDPEREALCQLIIESVNGA